jgi:hypothetical protein
MAVAHKNSLHRSSWNNILILSLTDKEIVVSLSVREKVDLALFLLVAMTLSLYV